MKEKIRQNLVKIEGGEVDRGPRIEVLSNYIERELARLENIPFDDKVSKPAGPIQEFNRVFRTALDEVWSSQ